MSIVSFLTTSSIVTKVIYSIHYIFFEMKNQVILQDQYEQRKIKRHKKAKIYKVHLSEHQGSAIAEALFDFIR
jgi:hypothetical protein